MSNVSYVVGIPQPDYIRKHLLESARNMISILKEKQELTQVREQRREKVAELRETLVSLETGLKELHKSLPKQRNRPKMAKKKKVEKVAKKPTEEVTGLPAIKGLGPARIKKLNALDIHTPEDLAKAAYSKVEEAGIVPATARKLVERAREYAGITEEQVKQEREEQGGLAEMQALEEKLSSIENKLKNL